MRAREPDQQGHVDVGAVRLGYETFNDAGEDTIVFAPIDTCVHSRAWKGQVAVPRPALPRGHDRPAGQRPVRALARPDGVRRPVARRRHARGPRPPRHRAGRAGRDLRQRLAVAAHRGPASRPRPGRGGRGAVGTGLHPADRHPAGGRAALRRGARRLQRVVRLEPPLHPGPLAGLRGLLLREHGSRTALDQAARRHPRLQLRHQRARDAGREREPPASRHARGGGGPPARDRPARAGDPGDRRPLPAARAGRERRPLDRGRAPRPRGRGPPADGASPRARSTGRSRASSTGSPARPAPQRRRGVGTRRPPRALYLSSPIGLGHVRRDLAIADAMREQRPDLEIQWLTQSPVAEFLERRGEVVHPASRLLANESGHFESESGEHDLHAFQAVRRMDEVLVNNFMVFDDLVERETFDLWLGDEAWDLDHFLHEHPELKRAPFVWMTDFVGWVPMPDGGEREAFLTVRLQRRDGRARRPLPGTCATGRCSSATRPTSSTCRWGRTCRRPARGPRSTSTSRATSWAIGPTRRDASRAAPPARVRRGRGRLRRQRRRFGRRRPPAAAGRGVVRRGAGPHPRPADGRRRRPAHRPGLAGRAARRRGARLPARPRPAPRGLRRGRRTRRAEHDHGADGGGSAVPLLPARSPLRAAGARAAPARAAPRGAGDGLPPGRSRPDRRRAGRGRSSPRPTTSRCPPTGREARRPTWCST